MPVSHEPLTLCLYALGTAVTALGTAITALVKAVQNGRRR